MSRLDSFIERVSAQRLCLDMACGLVVDRAGLVLEIGLGNGRTYDHLRQRLPRHDILTFDRAIVAHPDCRPPPHLTVLGDIAETLPAAARLHAGRVVLVHSDIGDGVPDYGRRMAALISAALPAALAPGAVILSDEELSIAGTVALAPPEGMDRRRYFIYRRPA